MWPFSSTCQSKARLIGKTIVITGANSGIGKETARDLYRRGARVILACRNIEKAQAAVEELKKTPPSKPDREQFKGEPGELVICKLNLCSLKSVRECAKKLAASEAKIHVLINNAGVMMCPRERTEDGHELQLQSNHLGHFLLTMLLLPKMRDSAPGCRVINVSSMAHIHGQMNFDDLNGFKLYDPAKAYSQSKLSVLLFTRALERKLRELGLSGVIAYSLNPGLVAEDLRRNLIDAGGLLLFKAGRLLVRCCVPLFKTPEQAAQTILHCAIDEEALNHSGCYYE
ncbi:unnamed protein product [Trichogramma brassicae]|uniref:Uncharacterized protein n=1 Tax=Trichogramma brassicae TaxID=86971 RepID=A0A6H5HYM5_9HYME|nr:unnamed protein product [Trichogramma brassicae]